MAATRTKAIPQRLTGTVTEWKGSFGWIQPSQPVSHPQAARNKGRLFLAHADVEAELSGVGANVSFFVYADEKGLGAMNVRPGMAKSNAVQQAVAKVQQAVAKHQSANKPTPRAANQPTPKATARPGSTKPTPKAAAAPANGATSTGPKIGLSNAVALARMKMGQLAGETAPKSVYTPKVQAVASKAPVATEPQQSIGPIIKKSNAVQLARMKMGQVEAEPEPVKKPMAKAAPALRGSATPPPKSTAVTHANGASDGEKKKVLPQKFTGTVVEWKGSFGWIQPKTPIKHALASGNKGRVYMAHEDVEAELDGVGCDVQFFVYTHGKGLGAMNIRPALNVAAIKASTKPEFPTKVAQMTATTKPTPKAKPGATPASKAALVKSKMMQKVKSANAAKLSNKEKNQSKRTRVTDDFVQGEITKLLRNFGFIKLLEEVDGVPQNKAQKVFFHMDDVEEGTSADEGTVVQCHLYKDLSGFGCEEISEA